MERDEQVTTPFVTASEFMAPVLDVNGKLIKGSSLDKRLTIIARENERMARKMDAAHILDEINRDDEAIRDYYYAPKVPSFEILKRSYDNQAFHFKDEEK